MQPTRGSHEEHGFSLLEVLVALALITIVMASLSQLFAVATASDIAARDRTMAALLAEEKLEELRELTFAFDRQGAPMTDLTTDTARDLMADGGTGLTGGGSLDRTVAGYSDDIDSFGRRTDASRAAFVRRWSIQPLASDPANTIAIQVMVLKRGGATRVRLVSARTRKPR